jgi:membrane associated rhomboid family serine protease
VIIMGALALYFSVSGGNSGVSNVAHLGGLLVGFVYMKLPHTRMPALNLGRRYEQWKLQRARRKFQVYMRKQDSKREPWVH